MLGEYLREIDVEYSEVDIAHMAECISTHKGSIHGKSPISLEAKVVADADLLEKFGPFGVYQTVRTYAEFNWPIERAFERGDKILGLRMETATGTKLSEKGRQFTAQFYKELKEAHEPYKDK